MAWQDHNHNIGRYEEIGNCLVYLMFVVLALLMFFIGARSMVSGGKKPKS